jgi:chromosome segregation protein
MTVGARLLSVRLQGFKSFAARTVLEFGPGISAVVGPNGAGKSNLADALRWTFGEQGRALRSRRAEDIIFAGSEGRAAVGMADVTVVVDNSDGLLPVEYSVVELGRRLFRSGENEYLLNGTRVRLRDLEELLDAAHLADNAFLFIGQGMVDQALALRPEERRPLFDEVAGVRRHDRRKRAAEAQLVESEANLARVGDLLAEMRPQARRLAAQARQQAARSEAGAALAEGIVTSSRFAWHEAATRLRTADERRGTARAEIDAAIGELRAADDAIAAAGTAIDDQLAAVRAARVRLDEARGALADARVDAARHAADREARTREQERLERERAALEERMTATRRRLALPPPAPPAGPEDEPADDAARTAAGSSAGDSADAARARLAALRRGVAEEDAAFEAAATEEADAVRAAEAARSASVAATRAAETAATDRDAARDAAAAAEGRRDLAVAADRAAAARVAEIRERLAALDRRLGAGSAPGASLVDRVTEALRVEPDLELAVEAALGAALEGAIVTGSDGAAASSRAVVFRDLAGPELAAGEGAESVAAVSREGGGRLADAIIADPNGIALRLLRRALWVPDARAALRVAASLGPGWTVTTTDGQRLHADGVLEPPAASARLSDEQERSALTAELPGAEATAARAAASREDLEAEYVRAVDALKQAEVVATTRESDRMSSLAALQRAERRQEIASREAAWATVQRERRDAEIARLEALAGGAAATAPRPDPGRAAAWSAYRDAVRERQRLEGSLGADAERLRVLDDELAAVAGSLAATDPERQRSAALIAGLEAEVGEQVAVVAQLEATGSADRRRLEEAERTRRVVRDRIQGAEGRARAAEIDELEARMTLDGVRERLLVELASLGANGLLALGADRSAAPVDGNDSMVAVLEAALAPVEDLWSRSAPEGEAPSAGRLASLRRRYQEVGVENPFAAEEHAEIEARLSELEAQREDLVRAIASTRQLIADLERLIVDQFQATFRALESAFERRFGQLFGGGTARLSLTDPADVAGSGVEIVARPPGKKPQALAMLSGGERALTAVALLFAMLEVRPVPFCVLDEVDAALDEANIGRFAAALRDLAGTIQFVVITHNRGTIEQADALYGVTIGDDAVSRIVSLRLEPAGTDGSAREPTGNGAHPGRGRGVAVDQRR